MTYKVVSLFAGCGGLDIGFKETGFNLAYACDIDPIAVECYKRNIDQRVFVRDVRDEAFRRELLSIGNTDVVLGGFPCQGFSKAGPKRADDTRNFLYLEMKEAIEILRPKLFIAENVDGLSQNFGGSYLDRIVSDFKQIGYSVQYKIIDAISFGVAQHRRRIFFVGIDEKLPGQFIWPSPTHQERRRNGEKPIFESLFHLFEEANTKTQEYLKISDVIGDLIQLNNDIPDHMATFRWPAKYECIFKKIKPGQKLCNVRHADTSVYAWDIPEVFGAVTDRQRIILNTIAKYRRHKKFGNKPNGNPLPIDVIEELSDLINVKYDLDILMQKGYVKKEDNKFDLKGAMFCSGLFKRPKWDEPSPTVLTNFHNPRYFLHPLEDRPFSARECARLQGFPDSFIFSWDDFQVRLEDRYRLIGNAVAVPVSRAIARATLKFLTQGRVMNNADSFEKVESGRTVVGI